mmetsp:Transcript_49220/g.98120  ORF Transcript_49220/g.98120 Transcript_49220/m.98120 type:complete len:113 (-) Transcript_49220:414-752(-)
MGHSSHISGATHIPITCNMRTVTALEPNTCGAHGCLKFLKEPTPFFTVTNIKVHGIVFVNGADVVKASMYAERPRPPRNAILSSHLFGYDMRVKNVTSASMGSKLCRDAVRT